MKLANKALTTNFGLQNTIMVEFLSRIEARERRACSFQTRFLAWWPFKICCPGHRHFDSLKKVFLGAPEVEYLYSKSMDGREIPKIHQAFTDTSANKIWPKIEANL